ncbi:restriction endonuclease [Kitasatospora sp. A2-31]|uniref:nSTAND3 domain-containing NTPase n=1 Tax=Kitasatospora sp. A2-31 TaxID=2916414 RepID=UPI001EEBB8D8|nr:restriction endonuclease [Kitasatospora sp. A2-31]MCG6493901.1 restriction endonuclease [Kitasatospora sp. A2-31]
MDSFDLGRLTDHDFELVCRDLFGELLGVPLELFPRGRDQGIDLRHTDAAGASTVVQCKHWQRGDQNGLIRRLVREELPKVARLKPDRYVIATTVGLTVDGKERLRDAFAPFIRSTGDIHGVDEIVAELRNRPALVRRHFRLWLSSTTVLQTVLHQERHLRSSWLRRRLPRVAETFVPHEGFERAKQVLDEQRVCVVAGIPGVGKTTVALMLSAWLMGNGYELHEVSQDIDEVGALWLDGIPQVFLYDDFLGQTTLESPLNKNEDSRLLAVVREIRETPGKALIMTTRDYILEHARLRHDRLAAADVTEAASVIHLTDLGLRIRGQILYNHVHNSAVPPAQKRCFADRAVWQPVVTHRNFNPRLIEETLRLAARREQDVPAAVLANLDDPQRIWERIVEHELTDEAVHLLEVLLTLQTATLSELEESWSWYRRELDRDADGRLFRRALQVLEGTMVTLDGGKAAFHNPSIADYLRLHLNAGRTRIPALLAAFVDARQLYRIIEAARLPDGGAIREQLRAAPESLADAVRSTLDTVEVSLSAEDYGLAAHLQWALEAAELLDAGPVAAIVLEQTRDRVYWTSPDEHLAALAEAMRYSPLIPREHAERFGAMVDERIRDAVQDCLAAGGWGNAMDLAERLSANALDDPALEESLLEAALDELRELAGLTEDRLTDGHLDVIEELLGFLVDHEAEGDLPEEFERVTAMARRLADARRERRVRSAAVIPPGSRQVLSQRERDATRDHAVVAELMRGLDRTDPAD